MDRFSRTLRKLNERKAADTMTVDEAVDMMPEAPNEAALFVFTVFALASNAMDDGPIVTLGDLSENMVWEWVEEADDFVPVLPICETCTTNYMESCGDLASHTVTWEFYDDGDPLPEPITTTVCNRHLDEALEELFPGDVSTVVPIYAELVSV